MLEKPDYKQFNLMYNINNKGLLTTLKWCINNKTNQTKPNQSRNDIWPGHSCSVVPTER